MLSDLQTRYALSSACHEYDCDAQHVAQPASFERYESKARKIDPPIGLCRSWRWDHGSKFLRYPLVNYHYIYPPHSVATHVASSIINQCRRCCLPRNYWVVETYCTCVGQSSSKGAIRTSSRDKVSANVQNSLLAEIKPSESGIWGPFWIEVLRPAEGEFQVALIALLLSEL
ncbi:hypothetical protein BX600DRAFT_137405 [Xylariales sp. PMI_506]|nr:hypothetical protein BX600DRAFT_137405 [Xylariales sp. PMI_506]